MYSAVGAVPSDVSAGSAQRILTTRTATLGGALALTLVLNLVDLVATLFFTSSGLAIESNPLMSVALDYGTLPFALVKLALVSAGVLILWQHRERPIALGGALAVFAAYAAVALYHGHWLRVLIADGQLALL